LFPTLGAIISGAVLGNNISPISDVTVMASSSAGAYHLDYIYAQLYYAIPMAVASIVAFVIAGHMAPYGYVPTLGVSLGSGLLVAFGLSSLLNLLGKRSH